MHNLKCGINSKNQLLHFEKNKIRSPSSKEQGEGLTVRDPAERLMGNGVLSIITWPVLEEEQ